MKKKTNKRKGILSELLVMTMIVTTLLTACSSDQASVTSTNEEIIKAEVTEETIEVEEEVADPAVTEKTEITDEIEEATEEVTKNEDKIEVEEDEYVRIDMESALSGVEWIQTFEGIIEEPKLIVFNDSTNKKVILEDMQEIEFYDDDTLAVYIPKGRGKLIEYLNFEEAEYYDNIVTLRKMPSAIRRGGYSAAVCIDIEFDGKPMTLYCYLKLMG